MNTREQPSVQRMCGPAWKKMSSSLWLAEFLFGCLILDSWLDFPRKRKLYSLFHLNFSYCEISHDHFLQVKLLCRLTLEWYWPPLFGNCAPLPIVFCNSCMMSEYLLCPLFFQTAKQITVLLYRCAVGRMPILRSRQSPVCFPEIVCEMWITFKGSFLNLLCWIWHVLHPPDCFV